MDYIINGGKRLNGEIKVYGAKNCVLPLLGASLLTHEAVVLRNCPRIKDIENMVLLLQTMGKSVIWQDDVIVVSGHITTIKAPQNIAKLLRGSALILGSSLARYGQIDLPLPGGCAIGKRPMDIHLDGLESMGVKTDCDGEILHCLGKPRSASYAMRFPSVGATENLLCAAVFAKGVTVLQNCATEPEVEALERMLAAMGSRIEGIGTPTLEITGVESLHGIEFEVIPDRIVAATYISAAIAAGGKITVTHCNTQHLRTYLNFLYDRFDVTEYADAVTVTCENQPPNYGRIVTAPYPFFPTDMQSLMLALASFSNGGATVIRENLFENRLAHIAKELKLMGANISVRGNTATVIGSTLHGANVTAYDLRGGAALIVAGLNASGRTVVSGVENVCRGYLNFAEELSSLGAEVKEI